MHKSECKHAHLKIGFIGFGKYGYGVMTAILKSGHHNINNVYYLAVKEYLKPDEKDFTEHNNHATYLKENLLPRFSDFKKYKWNEHYLAINKFIAEIASDEQGVLVVSLNNKRGKEVFEKLSKKCKKKSIWIFSSVSKLEISKPAYALDSRNQKM